MNKIQVLIMSKILFMGIGILATLVSKVSPSSNLCSTSGLCCKHRDSQCVAQKINLNHTVDTSALPCYCDHACLRLQDCCPDFKEYCQVMDCRLSEWGPWSPCRDCSGYEERRRIVLKRPRNGGQKCPPLKQTQPCSLSHICKNQNSRTYLPPARIEHHFNITKSEEYSVSKLRSFCAETIVLRASKGCVRHGKSLQLGARLCVKCEDYDKCSQELSPTVVRKFRLSHHCHGKIMSLKRIFSEDCSCSTGHYFKLIL